MIDEKSMFANPREGHPFDRVLTEAILGNPKEGQPELDRIVGLTRGNLYFKAFMREMRLRKILKEARSDVLQGDVTDETDATNALGEVYNQIIMGVEEHIPLDFARIFTTNKSEIKVPVGTYGAADAITAGKHAHAPKTSACVTIPIDEEWGVDVSWTRAHLEDAAWDVLAEQNEGAGYAIQLALCDLLTGALEAVAAGSQASGAELAHNGIKTPADPTLAGMTWDQFCILASSLDLAGTGPCTHVLVRPYDYWALLRNEEFINSLYAGSDEVMRTGIAKTMFGITVLRVSGLTGSNALGSTTNHAIAVNSKKSIALAYRRHITIEPYQLPQENSYGFVATVRAVSNVLVPAAVQVSVGSIVT